MENNLIEKYELIDGTAVVDADYNIVTANEEMYRFMGYNINTSVLEVIHQVDADDFMDVCTSLQKDEHKNMVLRMRRNDNSYRWMLIGITRRSNMDTINALEYWELEMSDIIAMKQQNTILQNSLLDSHHLLAMENELFFTYDFETRIFGIHNFIDHELSTIMEQPMEHVRTTFIDKGYVSEESKEQFFAFCHDVEEGVVSFQYHMKADFLDQKRIYHEFELKGSSIYSQMEPRKVVGSMHANLDSQDSYNKKTYEYSNKSDLISYPDIRSFSVKNIEFNPDASLTMIVMEVDHLNRLEKQYGGTFADELEQNIIETVRKLLGYRGIICRIKKNLYTIAIKDLDNEINVRAFVQSIRTRISWNYQKIDPQIGITFSMGIATYPTNGTDVSQIHRKMVKGLQLAEDRGGNRYIIYKEYLHGEMD